MLYFNCQHFKTAPASLVSLTCVYIEALVSSTADHMQRHEATLQVKLIGQMSNPFPNLNVTNFPSNETPGYMMYSLTHQMPFYVSCMHPLLRL